MERSSIWDGVWNIQYRSTNHKTLFNTIYFILFYFIWGRALNLSLSRQFCEACVSSFKFGVSQTIRSDMRTLARFVPPGEEERGRATPPSKTAQ